MPDLTPQQFVAKWERAELKETASAQQLFIDVCRLVGHPEPAGDFAPRLDALHRKLDRAVCDAYGWEHAVLDDDEEILRRLLALNLARAGQGQ